MAYGNENRLEQIEAHVSTLLILAGVFLGVAGLNRAIVFVNSGYDAQSVSGPLLILGILAAALAIIGIYSKTVEHASTVAKAAGGLASLALLGFVIFLLWTIASRIVSVQSAPGLLALVSILSFLLAIILAGVAVLRTSSYPPLVGYLLIAEALALVLVFVTFSVIFPERSPPAASLVLELAQGSILLAAGFLTRQATDSRY